MVNQNRNYIYAYDDKAHQIIVIDAETGEKIDQKENRSLAILAHLNENREETKLRKFTVWCARQTNQQIKPLQRKFIELAEQAIQGEVTKEKLQGVYRESEGEAVATDTVGLRQGSEGAPGFLASRECVNPDAFEGAKNAARFHLLWAEIKSKEGKSNDFFNEVRGEAPNGTIKETEQQQVDYLLDLMSS